MGLNKILIKNKVDNKDLSTIVVLELFGFLILYLNVLLNDSVKSLEILSSKSLTTIWLKPSKVFFNGLIYKGNPSITIYLGALKSVALLNKENGYSDHLDLFRFQDGIT